MAVTRYLLISILVVSLLGLVACAGGDKKADGPDGARLYDLHCSACHGDLGKGGVGVPLALKDFLESVDDDYLKLTIRVGRPGRVMPAFWYLQDDEIQAIVDNIRNWMWSKRPEFSDVPVAGDPQRGAKLYGKFCAECHGPDGEGGEGTGLSFSRPRDLPILAPALNNPGFLAASSDQMMKRTLMKGRSTTPMGSFLDKGLDERDIDDIVAYIRSYPLQPTAEATRLRSVSEAVIERQSPYPYGQTMDKIRRAITAQGFAVVREQYLEQGLVQAGDERHDLRVIYFTSFESINDALDRDSRMGLFLPNRLTVMEQDGAVKVMAANPRQLGSVFNNTALNEMGESLYQSYLAIFAEAGL